MSVNWNYFEKFEPVLEKYMPARGQGNTVASQVVTAVNKLVYKWYNDGDVYDNTGAIDGWCNDISSYANWIAEHCGDEAEDILQRIFKAVVDDDYEEILKDLADLLLDVDKLEVYDARPAEGDIYSCEGEFKFEYRSDEDDEEESW